MPLLVGGVVCMGLATGGGCARTRVADSLATAVEAGDVNAELDFWDALTSRPVVSNNDALHAMLLFADGEDPTTTYEQRVQTGKARGWLENDWEEPADLSVQRGTIARAMAVQCGIKGGVMMAVLGPHPRYATRELQYLGLMGPGSQQQAVTGRELMGVLTKAQDYLFLMEARARATAEDAGEQVGPQEVEPGDAPADEAPPPAEPTPRERVQPTPETPPSRSDGRPVTS